MIKRDPYAGSRERFLRDAPLRIASLEKKLEAARDLARELIKCPKCSDHIELRRLADAILQDKP